MKLRGARGASSCILSLSKDPRRSPSPTLVPHSNLPNLPNLRLVSPTAIRPLRKKEHLSYSTPMATTIATNMPLAIPPNPQNLRNL